MKRQTNILLLLFLLTAFSLIMLPVSGRDVVSEVRKVGEFDKIHQLGKFSLIIEQSDTQEVIIKAEEDLLNEVETSVNNNTLTIRPVNNRSCQNHKNIVILIKTPVLEQVKQAGAGSIHCQSFSSSGMELKLLGSGDLDFDGLYVKDVQAEVSGSGNMNLNLKSENLKINIYGSGNLTLEGYAAKTDYKIAGSGKVKAENLVQDYCNAGIYGSGNLYLNVRGSLDAGIFGSGNIYYKGKPDININTKGSGKLYSLTEE